MTARVSERTVMAEYDRALAASPYLAERIKLGAPALDAETTARVLSGIAA